jgi:hypothetical protein
MLGAGVLLFKATGNGQYLRDAKSVAAASLAFYNTPEILAKQGAAFNSIWFKNLLILDSVAPDPRYRKAMQAYADYNWNTTRDPATNLYNFGEGSVALLQQSGITQVHALLAWPRSQYHLLA